MYLSPFLLGTDKAGLSSSHVSHLASSKRVPLRPLSTEKQKQATLNLSSSKYTIIKLFHSIYQLLISLRGRFTLHRLLTQGHRQPCTFTFHVFRLCDEAPHRKVPSWMADSNTVPSSMTVPTTVPLCTAFLLTVTHPGHHQGGTGTFRHYWGRLDSEYNQTHLLWRPVNKNREHCKSSHNLRYKLSHMKF